MKPKRVHDRQMSGRQFQAGGAKTLAHAPFLSHATQTHSRAFTHLLSQPHEELKIEEKSKRGWREGNVGGKTRNQAREER